MANKQTKETDKKELRKHFIETLYYVLKDVVSPTPYLQIVKDDENDSIDVKFLDGRGMLHSPNSTEITVQDIDIASLFFDDFHVLKEGVTGVGKTYGAEAVFDAIFGSEGYYTIRLSGGVLGSSVFEPFTTTTLENGVPKTRVDHDKCKKYGALFIDEINRGDCQESFQVIDGKIHVNGDTGYLGIPIPKTERLKGLSIVAAMNPPDALHSAGIELDIAGENRFLKFKFPNGVAEAGSSQLEKRLVDNLHENFWKEFAKRSGVQGGWREIYPLVTDSKQFPTELDGETREFIDVAIGFVGYDPKETHDRNMELIQQGGYSPNFSIRDDNNYQKILSSQSKLKHSFVRRDLRKIQDLSRLLAFIKGIKNKTFETDVDLDDATASIGIILESKTITGSDHGSLIALVNEARSAYTELHKDLKVEQKYGLREFFYQAAVYAGQENGFEAYMNTLENGMMQLSEQAESAAKVCIQSRALADLVVLEYFSKMYEEEVSSALEQKEDLDCFGAIKQLYEDKKDQKSVYEHRLDSIIR